MRVRRCARSSLSQSSFDAGRNAMRAAISNAEDTNACVEPASITMAASAVSDDGNRSMA